MTEDEGRSTTGPVFKPFDRDGVARVNAEFADLAERYGRDEGFVFVTRYQVDPVAIGAALAFAFVGGVILAVWLGY